VFLLWVLICVMFCVIVPMLRWVHAVVFVPVVLLPFILVCAARGCDSVTLASVLCAGVCGLVVSLEQDKKLTEHFVKTTLVRDEISVSMTIIRNLLPRHVIHQLVNQPRQLGSGRDISVPPPCDKFECVSILFADIVGFTAMSARMTPQQLVDMLNSIFSHFDRLAIKNKVYKVETIGDCYFCASGLPHADKFHADNIVQMALDMQNTIRDFTTPLGGKVQFRVGIHSGPVVAGVVGSKMPRYHLFGETVEKAARMEQTGQAGRIKLSCDCVSLVTQQIGQSFQDEEGRVMPMVFTESLETPTSSRTPVAGADVGPQPAFV